MSWRVDFLKEAENDMNALDGSAKKQVDAAILKVSQNPLPKNEGGYGNALGNKHDHNLTGLCKIKLLKLGIRVVYKLIRENEVMNIVVVAARADEEIYKIAAKRSQVNK